MLRWAKTLHNLSLYAHSLCLIDQTQMFSLAQCPIICTNVIVLCRVKVENSEQNMKEQWVS